MTIDLKAIAEWLWGFVLTILSNVHAGATVLGVTMGVFLAEALAHFLPPGMDAYAADRITRLVCLGVSLCSTFALDPSLVGFCLALLAGLAGPTVHVFVLRYINQRWPNLTPKALVECPGEAPARPLIPPRES